MDGAATICAAEALQPGVADFLEKWGDPALVCGPSDRIVHANTAAEVFWDRSASQIVGQSARGFLAREFLSGPMRDASVVHAVQDGDGRTRICELYSLSLPPLRAFVLRDVTDIEQERERLRQLSSAAEVMGTSVVVTDSTGRIQHVNGGFEALTGYDRLWAIGRKPGSFLQGPLTDPETVRRIGATLSAGRTVSEEIVNYTRDGAPYWIELDIAPIKDEAGGIKRFVSVQSNVTKRQNDKRRQNAMLTAISTASAIAQWSADGRGLDRNAFLSERSKRIPALDEILPPSEITAVADGRVVRREIRWPTPEGALWLDAIFSSTRGLGGEIDGIIMSGADATARRESIRAGSTAMSDMLKRMAGLTGAIRRVSKLTHILSVNASIEAGRAGEVGHGFNIIAGEIGRLSAEVNDTLTRIDELISEGRTTVTRLDAVETDSRVAARLP